MDDTEYLHPLSLMKKEVKKGWGKEIWLVNNELYCLKRLVFNQNSSFSMHYHKDKDETWTVDSGDFVLEWIDLKTAERKKMLLGTGSIVRIPPYTPHKLSTERGGLILEASTTHRDSDSYRIEKGDSQQ